MNRREFSALLPMLLAAPALAPAAEGQAAAPQGAAHTLAALASGQYPPGPPTAPPTAAHISHHYMLGMLPDNIRLESHDSILAPGAPHEAIGHHKHSEIWFIRTGEAILMTAGVTRTLKAGDIGLCVAGDEHYVANASQTEPVSYLVITVGPPE
ncbi:MAG: cupin domain-containing protein [Acidobacteriaceae bacterium]|nr:cupin domain-containing protein [Acidobacteriaceae bacterium]